MGARTLETRLSIRLLALGGVTLASVAVAAIAMTERALDRSDTDAAMAHGNDVLDALERERIEGDSLDEALREVIASAQAEGARVQIRRVGLVAGAAQLPVLDPSQCVTFVDEHAEPWRACGVGSPSSTRVTASVPIGAHRAVIRALWSRIFVVVGAASLAMWLAVRRALRAPLDELASLVQWTARVADVERAETPPPARTVEVVQLGEAFDAVVKRLLASLARERASSAHIAHELRTPLTAIVTELEALRAHPAAQPAAERILGDVARFTDVIDAILELSAGDGVREPGARTRGGGVIVNLADVVREVAPRETSVEAPDEALLELDERLVRLALRNLVDNARKYGAGPVLLRVSRSGDTARLTVVDQGPGVDAAARERMFERYWRGSADGGGRGLGLALVRSVAERYGGHAEARSGPHGRGLEVSMTFTPLVGWHERTPDVAR
jgi:two-component system OmpR family sensor kinase